MQNLKALKPQINPYLTGKLKTTKQGKNKSGGSQNPKTP